MVMFQLDDDFQKEVGIFDMPKEAKEKLLEGITKMINDRVMIALSDQLTDDKVDELENIANDSKNARQWLARNVPNYANSQEYDEFKKNVASDADPELMFSISKWLMTNLPTYPQELQQTIEEVKGELSSVDGK